MNKLLKGISHGVTTLLFLLLICMIVIVIATQASGEAGPELLGYQFKTVLSGSMAPDIPTGSVIGIKSINDSEALYEGDVITFRTENDIFVTHRIIDVQNNGDFYITQGDHNNQPDSKPVLRQNIIGIHSGLTIPYVGYATYFANTREGSALLLMIPGLMLIGYAWHAISGAINQFENKRKHVN